MTSIELRHLRYFTAVAEELHFGHAAERLRIAQPALSNQIKALERSLGVPLFIRDQRGVQLTDAGETLLEHARLVIELADRAVDGARLAMKGKRGLLKVGTPALGIDRVGNELLRTFRERNPAVEVEIHPGFVPQSVEALTRRTLDLAILVVPFESPSSIRYLSLETVEMLIAVPESHRLASLERIPRSELLKEPFLDWPKSINPVLVQHLHKSLFGTAEPAQRVEVPDAAEVSRLLLVAEGKGLGVSVLPSLAKLHVPGVVFKRLEDPPLLLEYGIAWYDTNASPFVEAFVRLASEVAEPTNALTPS
jgi:DNA-binding transcriptional LysR family regulator